MQAQAPPAPGLNYIFRFFSVHEKVLTGNGDGLGSRIVMMTGKRKENEKRKEEGRR